MKWLHENGRMYDGRDHIHTLIYANRFVASRDADGVPAELALDHPWGGLVLLMVDRHEDVSPKDATAWLRDELLPEAMAGTPWALTVGLTPIPLPKEAPVFQPPNPGEENRTAMLCFLECDPRECWDVFEGLGEKVVGRRHRRRVVLRALHPDHPRHRHLHRPALVGASTLSIASRRSPPDPQPSNQ